MRTGLCNQFKQITIHRFLHIDLMDLLLHLQKFFFVNDLIYRQDTACSADFHSHLQFMLKIRVTKRSREQKTVYLCFWKLLCPGASIWVLRGNNQKGGFYFPRYPVHCHSPLFHYFQQGGLRFG